MTVVDAQHVAGGGKSDAIRVERHGDYQIEFLADPWRCSIGPNRSPTVLQFRSGMHTLFNITWSSGPRAVRDAERRSYDGSGTEGSLQRRQRWPSPGVIALRRA